MSPESQIGRSTLNNNELSGLVIKTQSGFYEVLTAEGFVTCQLRGALKQSNKKTELCVIGDHVTLERNADGTGSIKAIAPRERVLSRVEPSSSAGTIAEREQVIIANPDQAVFVFAAAKPSPHLRMLDRFLVAAEKAQLPSIAMVVNKIDLAEEAAHQAFDYYAKMDYPVLYVSAETSAGIQPLRELLTGKISVFSGASGVGNSSFLNKIPPSLRPALTHVSDKSTKRR